MAENALLLFTGAALGALHFEALRWNVLLISAPRAPWMALGVLLGRMTITVMAFVLIARLGALPLLLATAGFVAIRFLFVRQQRAAP